MSAWWNARFVHGDVVHYGERVDTTDGSRVYFLCERAHLLRVLYTMSRGAESGDPPMYEPGMEVFHVFDDVDCMTCLVLKARKGSVK